MMQIKETCHKNKKKEATIAKLAFCSNLPDYDSDPLVLMLRVTDIKQVCQLGLFAEFSIFVFGLKVLKPEDNAARELFKKKK